MQLSRFIGKSQDQQVARSNSKAKNRLYKFVVCSLKNEKVGQGQQMAPFNCAHVKNLIYVTK